MRTPKVHSCPACSAELHIKSLFDPDNPKRRSSILVRKEEPIPASPPDPMIMHYAAMSLKETPAKEVAAVMGGGLTGDADMMQHYASLAGMQA